MSAAKTLIATGVSSGIGFELIRQLLVESPTAWRMFLGVRDPPKTKGELDGLKYDNSKHNVSLFKVDYVSLRQTRNFAKEALEALGKDKLDYVLLNHAIAKTDAKTPAWEGYKWTDEYVVNHESHHYLMHLLRNKIAESHSRVVFVSSGAIRMVSDPNVLEENLKVGSDADGMKLYSGSKFIHLLGAHHWRRQLGDKATVVAVSPGMIPGTNLSRHQPTKPFDSNHPDAKSVPTGAKSTLAAFDRNDIPKDPNAIFLTSWGEWWDPQEIYPLTLDKELQDKFCLSQEEIEKTMD